MRPFTICLNIGFLLLAFSGGVGVEMYRTRDREHVEISEPKEEVGSMKKEQAKIGDLRIITRLGKFRVQRFKKWVFSSIVGESVISGGSTEPSWNYISLIKHETREDAQDEIDPFAKEDVCTIEKEEPGHGEFRIVTKVGWYRPQRYIYHSWSGDWDWSQITMNDFKTKEEAQEAIDEILEEERIAAIPWVTAD